MRIRTLAPLVAMWMLGVPNVGSAQQSDVTFKVPLNLTNLSPDIVQVRVTCNLSAYFNEFKGTKPGSASFYKASGQIDGGRLTATATIVIPVSTLKDPAGLMSPAPKTANWDCSLQAFTATGPVWGQFGETPSSQMYRMSPPLTRLSGSFLWIEPVAVAPANVTTTSPGGNP